MYGEQQLNGIHVSGTATVSVQPTKATISLGVVTEGKKANETNAENAKKMAGVYDALRKAGIQDKDISTTGLSLRPVYGGKTTSKLSGYTASQVVNVRVTKLDDLGRILDACVERGANNVNGLSFDADTEQAEKDALKAALASAKAKAQLVAQTEGVLLGKLLSFAHHMAQPHRRHGGAMAFACAASVESPSTEIAAGEFTLSVTATAVYGVD